VGFIFERRKEKKRKKEMLRETNNPYYGNKI